MSPHGAVGLSLNAYLLHQPRHHLTPLGGVASGLDAVQGAAQLLKQGARIVKRGSVCLHDLGAAGLGLAAELLKLGLRAGNGGKTRLHFGEGDVPALVQL